MSKELYQVVLDGNIFWLDTYFTGPDDNNLLFNDKGQPDENGVSLLMIAAREGHPSTVKFILENQADPNKQCGLSQDTALHLAVFHNNKECVRLLLQSGADINIMNAKGCLPI